MTIKSNKGQQIKIKSFPLIHEVLGSLHEELHRLLDPVRYGHEGGADDEHPQRPGGLAEASTQHSHRPEMSNQSYQQSEEPDEHAKLDPGV